MTDKCDFTNFLRSNNNQLFSKYRACQSSGDSDNLVLPLNRKHGNLTDEEPDGDPHRDLYHPQPQGKRAQVGGLGGRVRSVRREKSTFET